MKRNIAVLSLATLLVLPFSCPAAQVPALEALKVCGAASSFDKAPPLPSQPARYADGHISGASLSGEPLFTYLHEALVPAPRKAIISYKAAKSFMYAVADNVGCGGRPGILTFYSQVCVTGSSDNGNDYAERGDLNRDGIVDSFINAEHLWPQGYFNSALPMVADLHHLASTFVTPNGRRGNLQFAEVSRAFYSTYSGSKLGTEGFEPADAVKGNVARAIFYFIVRYHDKNIRQGMDYAGFWTKRVPMFLAWNRQDPPDANERRRNELVEDFQGNRNPFIDNPALAERIGELVFKAH